MEYVGYAVYAIAALFALSWVAGLRSYTLRGTPPTILGINQAMLFFVSLALVPALSLSPFHLLWMIPVSWLAGLLSLAFPFSLLSIFGGVFYRLACLGLDHDLARANKRRMDAIESLMIKEQLTPEQAIDRLEASGEWDGIGGKE